MTFGSKRYCCLIFVLCPLMIRGQLSFSEVTADVGIDHHYLGTVEMGGGAAFFDMDNDGDEDLWIAGGLNQDVLYENNGLGFFEEIGESAGLGITNQIVTTGVITGDLDNDGFKDVVLLTQVGFSNIILRNTGAKAFERVTGTGLDAHKAYNLSGAMADVNLDGYLDIYGAHYIEKHQLIYDNATQETVGFDHQCHQNRLYINNGDWTFSEVGEKYGVEDHGCALATTFSDYDGDHDPDLIIANDFGAWITPNALLRNDYPLNTFTDVSASSKMDAGIYGMGIAVGDYDGDLDLDYYVTNLGRNILFNNLGSGSFRDVTEEAGVEDTKVDEDLLTTGWGTAFMDFDNDRDLDLYVVNGFVPSATFIENDMENPNRLFLNDGTGNFSDIALVDDVGSPLRGRGFACADIDLDGDMDFLVINVTRQASSQEIHKVELYRNNLVNENHWLKVKLAGTTSNRDGLGASVIVYSNGDALVQEANGGYGTHASQHSNVIHFGLGPINMVDSLVVIWPGGDRQTHGDILANQLVEVVQDGVVTSVAHDFTFTQTSLKSVPNPFRGHTQFIYEIKQNSPVTFQIFDELGRKLFDKSSEPKIGEYTFNWQAPGTGIYYVTMTTNTSITTQRIISI